MNPARYFPPEPVSPAKEEEESNMEVPDSSGVSDENDLNLERLEYKTILEALRKNRYVISNAAKDLGLTRAALYRRMEKYGI